MSLHTIRNGVPTPEELGEFLGLTSERVSAVRSIMETPVKNKATSKASYRRPVRRSPAKKAAKKAAAKR